MPAQVWPLFGVEPSSLRPVPRVLDSHFPPLLRQKRATKQVSTCKAKFSAAQRKRRPLKFKQPRGCGTGGQRRSATSAWANTLLRPPPRSSSIPQLLPVSPDPGDRRSPRAPTHANTYQRASSGSTIPLAAAPQAPTSWQPRPAPPPRPRDRLRLSKLVLRHPGNAGRHRASSPMPSQRNLLLYACVHVRVCMGGGMRGWRRLGHRCPPLPVGASGAASRPG